MKIAWSLALLALLLCACSRSNAQPQPRRPEFSATFLSKTRSSLVTDSDGERKTQRGDGYRYYDATSKKAVTNTTFYLEGGIYERHFNLRRYDLGKQYMFVWKSDTILKCSASALNGSFEGFWDWVEEAEYSGRRNETGVTLDFWKSTGDEQVTNEVGVYFEEPDKPVVLYITHNGNNYRQATVQFDSFLPYPADPSAFDVPRVCAQTDPDYSKF